MCDVNAATVVDAVSAASRESAPIVVGIPSLNVWGSKTPQLV